MLGEGLKDEKWVGFYNKLWEVHKFGGTSVANANCFRSAATIVEEQIAKGQNNVLPEHSVNLAVVVSAMGGKPKVTDLLLKSVEAAACRNEAEVDRVLGMVSAKHSTCLTDLFGEKQRDRLMDIVKSDLEDIRDILKTVALMKWQAARISELVSGYGELWSAQILSTLLQDRAAPGHEFVYIDARRIITVDEEAIQDGAVVWEISQEKLEQVHQVEWAKFAECGESDTKMHFVITGYVASNTDGVATTLQRDGSDYSAAIMGRLLRSTMICIWTDVDGVLSADPRRVPDAHAVSEVSYNEAMELAYFGAKVIHPKTMQPAISCRPQIPIFIRNTFNSGFRGSRIYLSSTTNTEPDKCVCGFSSIDGMALINVEGSGLIGVHGVAKRLFGTLEAQSVNVVLISQASSEHSITFATIEAHATRAKEAISEEFRRELNQNRISEITINSPTSIIAAVGDGMSDVAGVSGRFFSALGDAQINVLAISQGCSERNISAVVSASQSTRALRALHAAFHLSHTTVRVGVIGMNNEGKSLVRLLEAQRRNILGTFDVDLQVCAVSLDSKDTTYYAIAEETSDSSITMSILENTINPNDSSTSISFGEEAPTTVTKKSNHQDLSEFLPNFFRAEAANHVIFDCTNDLEASRFHPEWLSAGVHVVTANNTGLSGSKELRDAIEIAESARGKNSAKYMREVTVSGAIPVISTLRTLLTSGDKIRRIDGIFSVSMSYLMYRISPPPRSSECGLFDEKMTAGAFKPGTTMDQECSFSEALKEAISLGLTEQNPESDLSNEYTARMMMVLAKELGIGSSICWSDIQAGSDKLGGNNEKIRQRVESAAEKGCVLRHVASLDVKAQTLEIKILEVPNNHVFAVTPPTSSCVRFFTHRYQQYPLVIQGPAAGADCTSSALLAEVLSLMSNKIGPKAGSIARSGSSAFLR